MTGSKSISGVSLGPVPHRNRWRFAADEGSLIDVGDLVECTLPNGRIVISAVVGVAFETNVEDTQRYIVSLTSKYGRALGAEGIRRIAPVALADCAPLAVKGDSRNIPPTAHAIPPLCTVRGADEDSKVALLGLRTDSESPVFSSVRGLETDFLSPSGADFLEHAAVVGSTGSGKSRWVSSVVASMASEPDVLSVVIDVHGEYESLLGALGLQRGEPSGFAVLALGTTERSVGFHVLEMEEDQFLAFFPEISGVAQHYLVSIFQLAKEQARGASLSTRPEGAVAHLIDLAGHGNAQTNTKQSVQRALNRLRARDVFTARHSLFDMLRSERIPRVLVIDTSRLSRLEEIYLAAGLLKAIFLNRKRGSWILQDAHIQVVIEEAHRFFDGPVGAALLEYFREARKFSVAAIAVTQRPADLDMAVLANVGSLVAFRLGTTEDIEIVRRRVAEFGIYADRVGRYGVAQGLYVGRVGRFPFEFTSTWRD